MFLLIRGSAWNGYYLHFKTVKSHNNTCQRLVNLWIFVSVSYEDFLGQNHVYFAHVQIWKTKPSWNWFSAGKIPFFSETILEEEEAVLKWEY